MNGMDFDDYRAMVEESPVATTLTEFRTPRGSLLGGLLADRLGDSLSAVYSFFDPDLRKEGFGTYMVLWLIERAKRLDLSYVSASGRKLSHSRGQFNDKGHALVLAP